MNTGNVIYYCNVFNNNYTGTQFVGLRGLYIIKYENKTEKIIIK
jgi:hypothetical protein